MSDMSQTTMAGPSQSQLPPGVHPHDPAEPFTGHNFGGHGPVPEPTGFNAYERGKKPYSRENYEALPVFERASATWDVAIVVVNSGTNGGTAVAAPEQKGRKSVTMSVPTTLPNGTAITAGVLFGPSQGSVQSAGSDCGILNVGDSITITTEDIIYIGVIGNNTTGTVQVVQENNPPGGGLGA